MKDDFREMGDLTPLPLTPLPLTLGDARPPFLSVGTPASTRDNLIRWRLVQLNLLSVISSVRLKVEQHQLVGSG